MTENSQADNKASSYNLTGHFLIAMPSLNDGFFNHAVTYICEHDESGSFGVIINQQTDIKLKQVIEEMHIESRQGYDENQPVYIGGPVDQGRGFILHHPAGSWSSSLVVNNDVALTTSKDILQAIANNEGPEDCIVALGYAGWSAGQLEQEMANNTWLSCPADEQIIFNTPIEERWKAAAKLIGIDLSLMSNDAGHA
ncbi:MAG: YqgE/AlgH family protein [Gammaproteobacteria bacterium]|jgi:putative transcriptional regulator|nr:YqgE/AlgH family protein [Gammaproteobacteria bacterium]